MTGSRDPRREVEQRLIQKSQEDQAFRSSLLDDPKAAIEREVGATLPTGLRIQVLEETSNTVYLVLPQATSQAGSGGELSDQELESVAGGWGTGGATTQQSCGTVC